MEYDTLYNTRDCDCPSTVHKFRLVLGELLHSPTEMEIFREHLRNALQGFECIYPQSDGAGARMVLTKDILGSPVWRKQGSIQKTHHSLCGNSYDIREVHVMAVRVAQGRRRANHVVASHDKKTDRDLVEYDDSLIGSENGTVRRSNCTLDQHLWEQLDIYSENALSLSGSKIRQDSSEAHVCAVAVDQNDANEENNKFFRRRRPSMLGTALRASKIVAHTQDSNDEGLKEFFSESILNPAAAECEDSCYSKVFCALYDQENGVVYIFTEHLKTSLERLLLYDPFALYGETGPHLSNQRIQSHQGMTSQVAKQRTRKSSSQHHHGRVDSSNNTSSGPQRLNANDNSSNKTSGLLEGSVAIDDAASASHKRLPSDEITKPSNTIGACFGNLSRSEPGSFVRGSATIVSHEKYGDQNNVIDMTVTSSNAIARVQFIIYQLFKILEGLHKQGIAHGLLSLKTLYITDLIWLKIHPAIESVRDTMSSKKSDDTLIGDFLEPTGGSYPWPASCKTNFHTTTSPYSYIRRGGVHTITERWRVGDISNLEYLMLLNMAAGRQMGDASFCPVLPWVTDFVRVHQSDTRSGEMYTWNLRDLTRSKFRLKKGDIQLDATYKSALQQGMQSLGVIPHHIPENLTDITFYNYLARVTPIEILQSVVRANFTSRHYPISMQHLYELTPDECIPEFYLDSTVFQSMHRNKKEVTPRLSTPAVNTDMPDLALPRDCASPSDFIARHRALLESEHVSLHLHHWIDLNFGFKLTGTAAVESKNVPLNLFSAVNSDKLPSTNRRKSKDSQTSSRASSGAVTVQKNAAVKRLYQRPPHLVGGAGFVQLFARPHPQRLKRVIVKSSHMERVSQSTHNISNSKSITTYIQPTVSPSAINSRVYLENMDETGTELLKILPFPKLSLESPTSSDSKIVHASRNMRNDEKTYTSPSIPRQEPSGNFSLPPHCADTTSYIEGSRYKLLETSEINQPRSVLLDMGRRTSMAGDAWDFLGELSENNMISKEVVYDETSENAHEEDPGLSHVSSVAPQLEAVYYENRGKTATIANDMFAAGCIMAQLYLPKNGPLFTHKTLHIFQKVCNKCAVEKKQNDQSRMKINGDEHNDSGLDSTRHLTLKDIQKCLIEACGERISMLPSNVLSTVSALVHPCLAMRPTASALIAGELFYLSKARRIYLNKGMTNMKAEEENNTNTMLFHDRRSYHDLYAFLSRWHTRSTWPQRYKDAWIYLPPLIESIPSNLFEGILIPFILDLLNSRSIVSCAANYFNTYSREITAKAFIFADLEECARISLSLWILCAQRAGKVCSQSNVLWGAINSLIDTSLNEAENLYDAEQDAKHSGILFEDTPSGLAAIVVLSSIASIDFSSIVSDQTSKKRNSTSRKNTTSTTFMSKTSKCVDCLPHHHKMKLHAMEGFVIPFIQCVGRQFFIRTLFVTLIHMVNKLRADCCRQVRYAAAEALSQLACKRAISSELVVRYILPSILKNFGQNLQLMRSFIKVRIPCRLFVPVRPLNQESKAWKGLIPVSTYKKRYNKISGLKFVEPQPPSFLLAEVLLGISKDLGEAASVRYLLPPVFAVLPSLFNSFKQLYALEVHDTVNKSESMAIDLRLGAPLLESLQVLYGMTSIMSAQTIFEYYVKSPPPTSKGLTLHRMLELMPFPFPLIHHDDDYATKDLNSRHSSFASVDSRSSASSSDKSSLLSFPHVHSILAKIVVKICERIGQRKTVKHIMPSIKRLMQYLSEDILTPGALARWENGSSRASTFSLQGVPPPKTLSKNSATGRRSSWVRSDLHEAAAAAAISDMGSVDSDLNGSIKTLKNTTNYKVKKIRPLLEQHLIVERALDYAGMIYFPLSKILGSQMLKSKLKSVNSNFVQAMYLRHDDFQQYRDKNHGSYFMSKSQNRNNTSSGSPSNITVGNDTEQKRDQYISNIRDNMTTPEKNQHSISLGAKASVTKNDADFDMNKKDTSESRYRSVPQGESKSHVDLENTHSHSEKMPMQQVLEVADASMEPQYIELMQMTGRTMVTPGGFIAPDWRVMRRFKRKQERKEKRRKRSAELAFQRVQQEKSNIDSKGETKELEDSFHELNPKPESAFSSGRVSLSTTVLQSRLTDSSMDTEVNADGDEFLSPPLRDNLTSHDESIHDSIISEDENDNDGDNEGREDREEEEEEEEEDAHSDRHDDDNGELDDGIYAVNEDSNAKLEIVQAPEAAKVASTKESSPSVVEGDTAVGLSPTTDKSSISTLTSKLNGSHATDSASTYKAKPNTNVGTSTNLSKSGMYASATELKNSPEPNKLPRSRSPTAKPIDNGEHDNSEMQDSQNSNSNWWYRSSLSSNSSIWMVDKRSEAETCGKQPTPDSAWPPRRRHGQPVFCVHSFSATTYSSSKDDQINQKRRSNPSDSVDGRLEYSTNESGNKEEPLKKEKVLPVNFKSGISLENGKNDEERQAIRNVAKSKLSYEDSDAMYPTNPSVTYSTPSDNRHLNLSVRKMLVDDNESILATGSAGGGLRLFALGGGAPVATHQCRVGDLPVMDMCFSEHQSTLVACDGGLHVFDMQTGKFTMRLPQDISKGSMKGYGLVHSTSNIFNRNIPAFTAVCPLVSGWYLGQGSGVKCPSIVAASSKGNLACLDLRMRISKKGLHSQFYPSVAAEWSVAPQAQMKHIGDNGRITSMATSSEMEWVAVGSDSGFVTILDQRNGSVLHRWQAHPHLHDAFGFSSPSFSAPSADVFNVGLGTTTNLDQGRINSNMSHSTAPGYNMDAVRSASGSSNLPKHWSSGSPILKIFEVTRGVLMTASADRTAMIWDLRASAPVLVHAINASLSAVDASNVSAILESSMPRSSGMRIDDRGGKIDLSDQYGNVERISKEKQTSQDKLTSQSWVTEPGANGATSTLNADLPINAHSVGLASSAFKGIASVIGTAGDKTQQLVKNLIGVPEQTMGDFDDAKDNTQHLKDKDDIDFPFDAETHPHLAQSHAEHYIGYNKNWQHRSYPYHKRVVVPTAVAAAVRFAPQRLGGFGKLPELLHYKKWQQNYYQDSVMPSSHFQGALECLYIRQSGEVCLYAAHGNRIGISSIILPPPFGPQETLKYNESVYNNGIPTNASIGHMHPCVLSYGSVVTRSILDATDSQRGGTGAFHNAANINQSTKKLKTKTTAMAVLPHHRVILVGAEDGNVRVCI